MTISLDEQTNIKYRYFIGIVLNDSVSETVVKKWESSLLPRELATRESNIDIFGYFGRLIDFLCYFLSEFFLFQSFTSGNCHQVATGWLNEENLALVFISQHAITWYSKEDDKDFWIKSSLIAPSNGQTSFDIAVLNDHTCTFFPQDDQGHLYNSSDYIIFKSYFLKQHSVSDI